MSTERWIVHCTSFSAATFFAGALYGEGEPNLPPKYVPAGGKIIRE